MRIKLVFMIALVFVLSGCQPAESYQKAANKLQIATKLTEIETKADQCCSLLDDFILSEQVYSSYQEKVDMLNYQGLNSNIQEIKQLLDELQLSSSQLKITDDHLILAHESLLEALENYKALINDMESALIISSDLDLKFYEIQTINKQILELSFSGEPASEAYKEALSEFLISDRDILEFMDLAVAEDVLSATPMDQKKLEALISDAKLCNEKLKKIQTYNETDQLTHNLIMQMYQHISDMYSYALENKQMIEWINQYPSFSVYYEEQKEIIHELLLYWQQALE